MPKGFTLPLETKQRILHEFCKGKSRAFLAAKYHLHIKTLGKMINDAKNQRRAELVAQGFQREDIERRLDREFIGDCGVFITIEHPGEIRKDFVMAV